jgi:uncharacterized protein (DUF952 family)
MSVIVLHLMPRDAWDRLVPGEPITNASLETEGFIHCTDDHDVLLQVANAFYRDAPGDFVVLHVAVADLTSACVWEAPAPVNGSGESFAETFPHVYGPIDRDAVVGVEAVRRDAGGAFVGYSPEPSA